MTENRRECRISRYDLLNRSKNKFPIRLPSPIPASIKQSSSDLQFYRSRKNGLATFQSSAARSTHPLHKLKNPFTVGEGPTESVDPTETINSA